MRKWIFVLPLFLLLLGCSKNKLGYWGNLPSFWKYRGKVYIGLENPVKENSYLIFFNKCTIKRNGKEIFISPLQALKLRKGEFINIPQWGCRFHSYTKRVYSGAGGKEIKLPVGIYLIFKRQGNFYIPSLFISMGKARLPKGKLSIIELYDSKGWRKVVEDFSNVSYIEIGNSSYQVHPVFPGEKFSFKVEGGKKLIFRSIVLSMPPEKGGCIPAPGVKFKVFCEGKGKKEILKDFSQRKGIVKREIELPSWAKKVLVEAEGKKLGNLSFITSPYIYTPSRKVPIVILISFDTVRAKSLSMYGGPDTSPFLAEFSKDALIYTRAYTPHPWTYDGHMAVFFSKYCWENPKDSVVEAIQKKGYYTVAFTGGGLVSPHLGFSKGFLLYRYRPSDTLDVNSSKKLYLSAKDFLLKNEDKPIFLFLHTYQAHSPYIAEGENFDVVSKIGEVSGIFSPLKIKDREKAKKLYQDEIGIIDRDFLKPFVYFLKREDLLSRTHIIIFADHGEQFYEHGNWEHGYSLYDEETHVPLIVKSKKFHRGKDSKLISLIHVWKILSRITGIKKKESWKERKNFLILSTPISDGKLHFPRSIAIIKDNSKLIYNLSMDKSFFRNPPDKPKFELFNLRKDPLELHNIYGKDGEGIILQRIFRPFVNFYLRGAGYKPSSEDLKKLRTLGYVE